MRKLIVPILILISTGFSFSLERQSSAEYRARRVALSQKTNGGAVLLFAPAEQSEQVYGFRQENNFYYLTGWTEPAAALLIIPAGMANPAGTPNPYTEIL